MSVKPPILSLKNESFAAILVLLSIAVFILSYFRPEYLFSNTTITGGDMASHVYPARYLRDYLLPHLKISGWSQAHYCGYPIFLFYFPLPFILIAALSFIIPFAMAFKLVTVLGVFLIPLAAYNCLRRLDFEFPVPATGAVFTLPFLFNEGNSMWGGNIPSLLAGEFAYQIGLGLFFLFAGWLYNGVNAGKHALRNAFLLAAIGLTHGYTFLFAVALAPFFILTGEKDALAKRISYLAVVYGLGVGLMSFWFVPMLANQEWTIPFKWTWSFRFSEIMPISLIVFLPLAMAAVKQTLRFFYFCYILLTGVVLFFFAYDLKVVDIRFVPFLQITLMLMAAAGFWGLVDFLKDKIFWLFITAASVMLWTSANTRFTPDWIDWNYSGFEQKKEWPGYRDINQYLKGSLADPRIAVEPSSSHERFGTMRAFESLPLFSGRQTLEGLYMQSSISSPFVFYQQGEMSPSPPCPYADYLCPDFNLERAIAHLRLFNVKDVIVKSQRTREAFKQSGEAQFKKNFNGIEIYELKGENQYAISLKYQPVIFSTKDWKRLTYEWFRNPELLDVPLILNAGPGDENGSLRGLPHASALKDIPKIPITQIYTVEAALADEEIRIKTSQPGLPVLIKVSYHPNWRVDGAKKIFFVTPSFMLVYPETREIRLHFGESRAQHAGWLITAGALMAIIFAILFRRHVFSFPPGVVSFLNQHEPFIKGVTVFFCAGLLVFGISEYFHTPQQIYNRAMRFYDKKQFTAAAQTFQQFLKNNASDASADHAAFFKAMSLFQNMDYAAAVSEFENLFSAYPESPFTAEALYHRGLAFLKNNNQEKAVLTFNRVRNEFLKSAWADYARDRLKEIGAG